VASSEIRIEGLLAFEDTEVRGVHCARDMPNEAGITAAKVGARVVVAWAVAAKYCS